MGGSTSRSARDPSGNATRRTVASPAGRGTTEALALACAPGASPRPTLSREFVNALGQIVAERTWATAMGTLPKTTYHHRDHLGSLRVATDAAGALADAHDDYPFGCEMGPVASASRKKFTGHERDEETGLDYMLARYYGPGLGRFLSVDPGFDVQPENPQSWGLVTYVRNSPAAALDPTGRYNEDFHRGLTEALALAAGYSNTASTGIAEWDARVDTDSATSPMSLSTQQRKDWHFPSSDRVAQMRGRSETAGSWKAMGQYLHVLQDSFSHAGYSSFHLSRDPDKPEKHPTTAMEAAKATYDALVTSDALKSTRTGVVVPFDTIKPLIAAWIEAPNSAARQAALNDLTQAVARYQAPDANGKAGKK